MLVCGSIIAQTFSSEAAQDVATLMESLRSKSESVRASAATELARLQHRDAIRNVQELLDDDSFKVRLAAAKAVTELGGRDGLEVLARLLLSDDSLVRRQSADALRSVSGKQHGYFADADLGVRRKGTLNWLRWARADGQTAKLRLPIRAIAPILLFNGKDLKNWQAIEDGKPKQGDVVWTVQDGVIRCSGAAQGYLRTKGKFTNYVLTVEWRWPPGAEPGDSGVFFLMTKGDARLPFGLEAQLLSGKAGDFWMLGSFAATVNGQRQSSHAPKIAGGSEVPAGQWNRMEIVVRHGNVSIRVNGTLQNRATGCPTDPGAIGLQVEGDAIEFRNIQLLPSHG